MNIAVFWPNWIGDAVMATPAVRALREQFAGAHLIGVMKPYVAGVLEGLPWLDSVLFLDSVGPWSCRWPAVAASLRRENVMPNDLVWRPSYRGMPGTLRASPP